MIVARINPAFAIPRGSPSQWSRMQPLSVTRVMRSCIITSPFQPDRLYSWTRPLLSQHIPTGTVDPATSAKGNTEYTFSRIEPKPPIVRRAWSTEESLLLEKFVREGKFPSFVYKYFPGRSESSVAKRMVVHRAAGKMTLRQCRHWSPEEDVILRKCIKERKAAHEAKVYLPNRTVNAIKLRMWSISKTPLKAKAKSHAARWKPEEDKLLYELFTQGIPSNEIYQHFPNRSLEAVNSRIVGIRRRVAQELDPLQITSTRTPTDQAPGQMANDATGKNQVGEVKVSWPRSLRRWTRTEDRLLEKLVKDFKSQGKDMDEKDFWDNISRAAVRFQRNGALFTRKGFACQLRWEQLQATPSPNDLRVGQWDNEEDNRFRQAMQKQIGDDFQVRVDILEVTIPNRWSLSGADEEDPRPGVRLGSPKMRSIDWIRVAADVGTRTSGQCQRHFYKSFHNGKRGAWSTDELERLEEGIEKYGRNWKAVSRHVGTRTRGQVSTLCYDNERIKMGKPKSRKRDD